MKGNHNILNIVNDVNGFLLLSASTGPDVLSLQHFLSFYVISGVQTWDFLRFVKWCYTVLWTTGVYWMISEPAPLYLVLFPWHKLEGELTIKKSTWFSAEMFAYDCWSQNEAVWAFCVGPEWALVQLLFVRN